MNKVINMNSPAEAIIKKEKGTGEFKVVCSATLPSKGGFV